MHEVSTAAYWEGRYRSGETGWDLGGPCPVFVDLLGGAGAPAKGRVAFPGCGRGHDVRLFRAYGYDAIGFDFAVAPEGIPFERLDVFELGRRYPGAFAGIVEYTCYCAIDPARRAEYAASLRAALAPGGWLVALLFPIGEKADGPPFGVLESEIATVLGKGLTLVSLTTPTSSAPDRMGRERLAVFRYTSTST